MDQKPTEDVVDIYLRRVKDKMPGITPSELEGLRAVYHSTFDQYNGFIDRIADEYGRAAADGKRIKISFGEGAPSFVLSDIATKNGSIDEQLLRLNRGVVKGCMDFGKLSISNLNYFAMAIVIEFYGLLQFAESDDELTALEKGIPVDLNEREPQIVLEDRVE